MAIYFPDHDSTFIHIPKNGGSSFEHWAVSNFSECVVVRDGKRHAKLSDLKNILESTGYTFTFVRNPFARLVSIFHFVGQRAELRQHHRNKGKKVKKETTPDHDKNIVEQYHKGFEEYVLGLAQPNFRNSPYEQGKMWYSRTTLQKEWLDGHVDKIIKLEDVNTHFKEIQYLLKCNKELPFVNNSNHEHYKKYYNIETKNIVEKIFKDDLDEFNYEF